MSPTFSTVWMGMAVCALVVTAACSREAAPFASASFTSVESLAGLDLHASTAEIVAVGDGRALRLEGLALVPDLSLENVGVEVEILAERPCYPGIVFRFADTASYELAYAVPHASGLPDAIQYDPVFNGGNTWQLHFGAAYQSPAELPMNRWFTLRVDVVGGRAVIQVDGQPPLVVEQLAHELRDGGVGLWCFRPAYFRNLRVIPPRDISELAGVAPSAPQHALTAWRLDGVGEVVCEPNGVLNLNRHLTPGVDPVRLTRRFAIDTAGEVALGVGFSDSLSLRVDGRVELEGENTFKGFDDLPSRGWVQTGADPIRVGLDPGEHEIEATLAMTEPFGWGLVVTVDGDGLKLLPVGGAAD